MTDLPYNPKRKVFIDGVVESRIGDISRELDQLVLRLAGKYSRIEECGFTAEEILRSCDPTGFELQHQGWGLDRIIYQIAAEIPRKEDKLTEVERTRRDIEEILNKGNTEERITVGVRIEHSGNNYEDGEGRTTHATVINPQCDVMIHLNPIEGGGNYRNSVLERLVKLESKLNSDFTPVACVTAAFVHPFALGFPYGSAVYHFAQKQLIRAYRSAGQYLTSFGSGYYPHQPSPRKMNVATRQIDAFIADYRFYLGNIIGSMKDMLLNFGLQRGLFVHSEHGPIATSANLEEWMVLHPDLFDLYIDARTAIRDAVLRALLPKNRRLATQLMTNVLADLAPARGVGLDVNFLFPLDQVADIPIIGDRARYKGREVAVVHDPEALHEYFKQSDFRDPFVNPEINALIGCKELFDPSNQHFYFLDAIVHAIELAREKARTEFQQIRPFIYAVPGHTLTRVIKAGKKKTAFDAIDNETGEQRVIKIVDPTPEGQRQVDEQGRTIADHASMESVMTRVGQFGGDRQALEHIATPLKMGTDGVRVLDNEPVTYLVANRYDGNLDDMFPLGHTMSPDQFFAYSVPILSATSLAHNSRVIILDLKFENIGIKIVDDKPFPLLDDFEQGYARDHELTSPNICSADTRAREIFEIVGEDAPLRADPTQDVHSLGAIFNRFLTGWYPHSPRMKKPLDGEEKTEYETTIRESVMREDYSPVFAPLNNVVWDLAEIVKTALQRDPNDRYSNAGEMLKAVKQAEERYELMLSIQQKIQDEYQDKDAVEHTLEVFALMQEIYPNASFAERTALLLHDADRGVGDSVTRDSGEEYAAYKKRHAARSRDVSDRFLGDMNSDLKDEILFYVGYHDHLATEIPSDDWQRAAALQRVMDVDALAFFLKVFRGYEHRGASDLRDKVVFSFNKMSTHAKSILVNRGMHEKISHYIAA